MEGGLSIWLDEVVSLQTIVITLKSELKQLCDKWEEGRMWICNIQILSIAEGPGLSSTNSVAKLLSEVLKLDKNILVNRAHWGLMPRNSGGNYDAETPHYGNCVELLHQAQRQSSLRWKTDLP